MAKDKGKAPLKTWIHGATGKMGREIHQALTAQRDAFTFVGGSGQRLTGDVFHEGQKVTTESLGQNLARTELIIDFSTIAGNELLLGALQQSQLTGKAILIGTTGLSPETIVRWRAASEALGLRVMLAPNTSLGVLLLTLSCLRMAEVLRGQHFDIEIIESHHRHKADSPSGTAKFIAQAIAQQEGLKPVYQRAGKRDERELGVFALRGGAVFGEHTVHFLGDFEELSLSHRALSRSLFAQGALRLAQWVQRQKAGFYQLQDLKLDDLRP